MRSQNFARRKTGRLRDKSIYKLKGSNCGLVMNSYLNDNLEDKQFFSFDSFSSKAIPLFFLFFRLASNAFPDIWSVGLRSDWKKKKLKKKSQEVSEQEAPVAQDDVMLLCCYYAHFSD